MKRIMKSGSLAVLFTLSLAAGAQQKQSLKDLLYSGKLKSDSGSVVRSSDDLNARIDTATKKPEESKPVVATNDPSKPTAATPTDAATTTTVSTDSSAAAATNTANAVPVKSNTKIWKDYTDSLQNTFKTELLPSKKIKKDTYFAVVDYEIGLNGAVNVLGVSVSPENAFLQEEIKKRMDLTAPQLAPILDSTGKARKTKKKYSFSLTKE